MFSCFKNQVLPDDTSTSTQTLPNYCNVFKEKTAFIIIEGVGSFGDKVCIKVGTQQYYKVAYNSQGTFNDILAARHDTNNIAKGSLAARPNTLDRLRNLTTKIIGYLNNQEFDKVVIIGCSHGALIVYGALLRVQMMVESDLIKTKLYVFTIGSPYYIPKDLLLNDQNTPKLLNAYCADDKYIKCINFLPSWMVCTKLPKNKTPPNVPLYDESKAILIVPKTFYNGKVIDFDRRVFPEDILGQFNYESEYYTHTTPYILSPVFSDCDSLGILENIGTPNYLISNLGVKGCDKQGGAKSSVNVRVKLLKTNKTYKVYVNSAGKKYVKFRGTKGSGENVLLSSIRGKYRYVRDQ